MIRNLRWNEVKFYVMSGRSRVRVQFDFLLALRNREKVEHASG